MLTSDGETDTFDIVSGILQGDTLAPFLFIIVLDYVQRISLDEKGLLIHPRRSRRNPSVHVTVLDFEDDLAITSDTAQNAEELLHAVEEAAAHVGLHCNTTKTEFISSSNDSTVKSLSGNALKRVDDFKYLGSYIMCSAKDFRTRKGQAWNACHKLEKVWRSSLPNKLKLDLFKTVVQPILAYGSETWTLKAKEVKRVDGCYANLLRRVQNISWRKHFTLSQIYGDLQPLSVTLAKRTPQFAGHALRAKGESYLASSFGRTTGRKLTFSDTISRDTGIKVDDFHAAMANKNCLVQN